MYVGTLPKNHQLPGNDNELVAATELLMNKATLETLADAGALMAAKEYKAAAVKIMYCSGNVKSTVM